MIPIPDGYNRDEVNIWRPGQTGISTDLLQIDLLQKCSPLRGDITSEKSAAGHPEKCELLQFQKFAFLARGARVWIDFFWKVLLATQRNANFLRTFLPPGST